MSTSEKQNELSLLCADALEELLDTSDAQIRKEAFEDGVNLEETAENLRGMMRGAAAFALRQQLYRTASSNHGQENVVVATDKGQSLEKIKWIIEQTFQRNPDLRLAYRDGKKQSENDWKSLYEDLIDLGVINPEDYAD